MLRQKHKANKEDSMETLQRALREVDAMKVPPELKREMKMRAIKIAVSYKLVTPDEAKTVKV